MQVLPASPITDMHGEQLETVKVSGGRMKEKEFEKITAGYIMVECLTGAPVDKEELSRKEATRRFVLASEIVAAEKALASVTIDVSDCSLILDIVAKKYAPLIVGQMDRILNPVPKEKIDA